MVVNVLTEHPRNEKLLLAGTEFGLFISIDGGKNWSLGGRNLPRVPVDDIVIQVRENDIILGSHGRGIIILDDIAMLENLNEKLLNDEVHLFPPRETIQFHDRMEVATDQGASEFSGLNPDYGALITYYIKDNPLPPKEETPTKDENDKEEGKKHENKPRVKIFILDKDQKVVRELKGPDRKGFNRISWDLHHSLSFTSGQEGGMVYGVQKGPFVLPGEYTVKLNARNRELVQKIQVRIDPQAKTNPEALQARFKVSMEVMDMLRVTKEAQTAIKEMSKEMERIEEMVKDQEKVPDEVKDKIQDISKKLEEIRKIFKTGRRSIQSEISSLGMQLQSSSSAPTLSQLRKRDHLLTKVKEGIKKVNELITAEYLDLQSHLKKYNIHPVIHKAIKLKKEH
jgi:hypothetical protein